MERCLTGVRGVFCAAHYSPEGQDHGHDYEVWAYWPSGPDARELKEALAKYLERLDHKRLPRHAQWDNQLAPIVGKGLKGCVKVSICRPLQGIKAVWYAD